MTLLSALLLGTYLTASAQAASADATPRLVTVTGSAELKVVPDEVTLTLGVETFSLNLAEARAENDRRVKAVLAAAEKHGVERRHTQTDYLSLEPRYRHEYDRREFLGYVVRKTIVITLRQVAAFEALLGDALNRGANHIHGIEFRTTELRLYRDKARALAIVAAREKAEALARALGRGIGEPRSIHEGSGGWWSTYGSWWGSRAGMTTQNVVQTSGGGAPSELTEGPLAPGQIAVTASVSVSFELK